MDKLEEKFKALLHVIGNPNSQAKRRLINAGSYLLKFLFSTLDSDDGEYYSHVIHKNLCDKKQIQVLIKNKIPFIKSAY